MPKKASLKTYTVNTVYHLYNRGAGKSNLFQDKKDYLYFLALLEKYLSPDTDSKSLYGQIELLCYTLMPDHYHFLMKQSSADAITKFSRKVWTSYCMYFNKRHKRSGTLFEGRFQAVIVKNDEQLLELSRYIHLNSHLVGLHTVKAYIYSSYHFYTGKEKPQWLKPEIILSYFNKAKKNLTYENFVLEYLNKEAAFDKKLILEVQP